MNNKKGFTLIELLVVVLIIGILASVALPQYMRAVEKSRTAEAFSILGAMAAAQEREFLRNGAYTATQANLDIDIPANAKNYTFSVGAGGTGIANRKSGGYAGMIITMTPAQTGPTYACSGAKTTECATFLP